MKNSQYLLSFAILSFGIVFSFIIISAAFAQDSSDVQYPVAELGNCKNKTACRSYCENAAHFDACMAFAKQHNLLSDEEIRMAQKFMAGGGRGPGGCTGEESCKAYCDNIEHIEECVAFAEENDILPPQELEEAKKVKDAIRRGVRPPACGNKRACDIYCSQAEHMEECMAFAEAAGFMRPGELEDAKKVLSAIKRGVKPPACRGKEECDKYCSEENHFEECFAFAEAAGFIPEKDLEMMKKTRGKGPGNCRGKEQCETFCNNPNNQEVCFNFAKEHGLIPEEDLKKMEEGKQRMMEGLNQAPPQVIECLNSLLGSDMIEKMRAGTAMPSRDVGDKMRQCFESMGPQMGGPQMGPGGPMMDFNQMSSEVAQCLKSSVGENILEQIKSGQLQPGPEIGEKVKSCIEQFKPQMPQQMPQPQQGEFRTGPGGCTTPEECKIYCQNNPQACGGFAPEGQLPPDAYRVPPEGYLPAQPGQMPPQDGQMPPPEYQAPPLPQPAPTEQIQSNKESFLGTLLNAFLRLFKR